jgi:hypothetical protein
MVITPEWGWSRWIKQKPCSAQSWPGDDFFADCVQNYAILWRRDSVAHDVGEWPAWFGAFCPHACKKVGVLFAPAYAGVRLPGAQWQARNLRLIPMEYPGILRMQFVYNV